MAQTVGVCWAQPVAIAQPGWLLEHELAISPAWWYTISLRKQVAPLSTQAAERLKRIIAEEMGIPLVPPLPRQQGQQAQRTSEQEAAEAAAAADAASANSVDLHPYNVRRSALALQRYAQQMPETKRRCYSLPMRWRCWAAKCLFPASCIFTVVFAGHEMQRLGCCRLASCLLTGRMPVLHHRSISTLQAVAAADPHVCGLRRLQRRTFNRAGAVQWPAGR